MKTVEVQQNAESALLSCLEGVPFVEIEQIVQQPSLPEGKPDLILRLRVGGAESVLLLAEVKSSGQPRLAKEAVNQLIRYRESVPNAYGVFVAPYISSEAARILREEGVGYADLAGNCRLSFRGYYIEREGRPNPTAQKRDLRSLYSPRASRIIRCLLSAPQRSWRIQGLADEARVSLGQAYNVKKLLSDREWIGVGPSGFSLVAPAALLAEWAISYDKRRNSSRGFYSPKKASEIEYDLAAACHGIGIRYALTGFSGAARYAPFVRYQRAAAFVDDTSDALVAQLALKPVSSGANLTLLLPFDEGVYYGARTFDGVSVASPIQVYLDLQNAHGRADDASGKLLEEVIKPQWRQAA